MKTKLTKKLKTGLLAAGLAALVSTAQGAEIKLRTEYRQMDYSQSGYEGEGAIVKKYDENGNLRVRTITSDVDGDGLKERITHIYNEEGRPVAEIMLLDINKDGKQDAVVNMYDKTGKVERTYIDYDNDGTIEEIHDGNERQIYAKNPIEKVLNTLNNNLERTEEVLGTEYKKTEGKEK